VHAGYVFVIAAGDKSRYFAPGHLKRLTTTARGDRTMLEIENSEPGDPGTPTAVGLSRTGGICCANIYEAYRFLSSGGSDSIRAHQRAVREAISGGSRKATPKYASMRLPTSR
jgi:hypothetical protein